MSVWVLEGPDAAGKTSYAELLLAKRQPSDFYIHNDSSDSKRSGSLYKFYKNQLEAALDNPGNTVIDRSFLSEYVYGRVYRGKSRISRGQAKRLTRWARRRGVYLVGFQAPIMDRFLRVRKRGEAWDHYHELKVTDEYTYIFQDLSWDLVSS